jgi:hypothetical protein
MGVLLMLAEIKWRLPSLSILVPATILICIVFGTVAGYRLGHPNAKRARPKSRRHKHRRRRRHRSEDNGEKSYLSEKG